MIMLGRDVDLQVDVSVPNGQQQGCLDAMEDACRRVDDAASVWSAEQTAALNLANGVTAFVQTVYQGRTLTRSFMAQEEGVFWWAASELTDPGVEGPRRPTMLFHDCWHAYQFQNDGYADGDDELVAREVDATAQQIEAARVLGCDDNFIQHLTDYMNDEDAIRRRLGEGVSVATRLLNLFRARARRLRPHFEIIGPASGLSGEN